MFEVSTNARSNMHDIAIRIALLALSSSLICHAQSLFLSTVHLKPLADPMTPATPLYSGRPLCLSRPTGCAEEELVRIGLSECAELRLDPISNRILCETTTTMTSTNQHPLSPPPPQKEEPAPDMVTSRSDLVKTIENLMRSVEVKEQLIQKLHNEHQSLVSKSNNQQTDTGSFGYIYPTMYQIFDDYKNNNNNNNDKKCNDAGDFGANCRSSNNIINHQKRTTTTTEPPHFSYPFGSSDIQDSFSQHKLETRARQIGSDQDYWLQEQEMRLPHHKHLRMTTDEAAKRLAEAQQRELLPESTTSKVPIILLKFGAIRNQRRSFGSGPASKGNLWSSFRMLPYPTIRLQRSDSDNLTSVDQVAKLAKAFPPKIDLDGESSPNGTMSTGDGAQEASVPASEDSVLECTMRRYSFKAEKSDESGNKCSGLVSATACYGGCETGEIADWLFPHKKPIHKVCTHGARIRRKVILTECNSNNVNNQLREYHYVDARSCVCQKCTSQDTNCLGSLTRPSLGNLGDSSEDITRIVD